MQRIKIPNSKPCRVYWPENLQKDGYSGELEIYETFAAIVIPKPNATNKDIAQSLESLLRDFKYRAQHES
jgi:hypothetical protein